MPALAFGIAYAFLCFYIRFIGYTSASTTNRKAIGTPTLFLFFHFYQKSTLMQDQLFAKTKRTSVYWLGLILSILLCVPLLSSKKSTPSAGGDLNIKDGKATRKVCVNPLFTDYNVSRQISSFDCQYLENLDSVFNDCQGSDNQNALIQEINNFTDNNWVGDATLIKNFTDFFFSEQDYSLYIDRDSHFPSSTSKPSVSFQTELVGLFETLSINGVETKKISEQFFFPENKEDIYSYYGKKLQLQGKTKSGTAWEDLLYTPKPLTLNGETAKHDEFNVSKTKGLSVTWNADTDEQNDKGIFIELTYRACTEKMYPDSETLPNQNISKYILVKDGGEYFITPEDLKDFPIGARAVEVTIHRGNYKIATVDNKKVKILITDRCQFFFVIGE